MLCNKKVVAEIVKRSLMEDLGQVGDITSDNLFAPGHKSKGIILAKEEGVISGLEVVSIVFANCNQELSFAPLIEDGQEVKPGQKLAEISGVTRDILKGERIALNFLQRLSGISTRTRRYIKEVKDYNVRITDTRKTTPNLRILEKYAVNIGGGFNHRMGLYDAVLIKDNHIYAAGSIEKAINTIRKRIPHTVKIEIEVESVKQVEQALEAKADIIMLDNMAIEKMSEAVNIIKGEALVEASGGISIENVKEIAATGVDIISIGALTHQINSLDISLDIEPFAAKKMV